MIAKLESPEGPLPRKDEPNLTNQDLDKPSCLTALLLLAVLEVLGTNHLGPSQ